MSRYVDKAKLAERLLASPIFKNTQNAELIRDTVIDIVVNYLTADVVEIRHGHWIKTFAYSHGYEDFYHLECSECGVKIGETALKEKDYKYCLNCGAIMDGERREE